MTTTATQFNPYNPTRQTRKLSQEMDMEQFMRLLTVQLATQNPLEPMNDRDFFAQMAQLGTVQGLDKIQGSLEVAQASSLIGKKVTATRPLTETGTSQADTVTGTVKSLTIRNGEYYLGVQQADGGIVEVKMANVRLVEQA